MTLTIWKLFAKIAIRKHTHTCVRNAKNVRRLFRSRGTSRIEPTYYFVSPTKSTVSSPKSSSHFKGLWKNLALGWGNLSKATFAYANSLTVRQILILEGLFISVLALYEIIILAFLFMLAAETI